MSQPELSAGRATPEGTRRLAARFPHLPGHFRDPDRLALSSLGLGLRNGEPGGVDDLLYREAVPRLLAGGVNVFVTGLSERLQASERNLGIALERAFREGIARRDEVLVATRGGYLTVDPDLVDGRAQARRYLVSTYLESGLVSPDDLVSGVHCLAPAFLRDQIQRSRRNLRLETLDLYLLEDVELLLNATDPDDFRRRLCAAFEALEGAVADGLIAAYGVGTWDGLLRPPSDRAHLSIGDLLEWVLDTCGADHHLRAVQLPYGIGFTEALSLPSQLVPGGATRSLLETLRGTGTAVLASAPLVQGRALGRLPEFVRELLGDCSSDAQRCIQFARSSPGITTAVVGMRDPEHVEENLALLRRPPASPTLIEEIFQRAAGNRAA